MKKYIKNLKKKSKKFNKNIFFKKKKLHRIFILR